MSDAHIRRVMVPETPKPTMATQNPDDPAPAWITCNHCSQRLISTKNIKGFVVQYRNPTTGYYVADIVPPTFRPFPDVEVTSEWIRTANRAVDLVLARIHCSSCRQPAGWEVLPWGQSHPAVNAGQILLPVPPVLPRHQR